MAAYCLFCETQKCGLVALELEQILGVKCISPGILQRKWVKGVCAEVRHSWLPGYVFLYSPAPLTQRIRLPGLIRWLGDGELSGEDAAFAEMLYRQDGVLGTVRLIEEGERCAIADPLWEGMSGTVVRIDRGRKRCCVEFVFDGQRRSVWLGYDLLKPAQDAPAPV